MSGGLRDRDCDGITDCDHRISHSKSFAQPDQRAILCRMSDSLRFRDREGIIDRDRGIFRARGISRAQPFARRDQHSFLRSTIPSDCDHDLCREGKFGPRPLERRENLTGSLCDRDLGRARWPHLGMGALRRDPDRDREVLHAVPSDRNREISHDREIQNTRLVVRSLDPFRTPYCEQSTLDRIHRRSSILTVSSQKKLAKPRLRVKLWRNDEIREGDEGKARPTVGVD